MNKSHRQYTDYRLKARGYRLIKLITDNQQQTTCLMAGRLTTDLPSPSGNKVSSRGFGRRSNHYNHYNSLILTFLNPTSFP